MSEPRGWKKTGWLIALAAGLIVVAGAVAWLAWRYTAPVTVRLTGEAPGLPLDIEIIPSEVSALAGEVISVTYRIHNTGLLPVAAFGRLAFDPPQAGDQVQIFLTECGGLNTYQNGQATELAVVFRVAPAGLSGASAVTLRHTFDPASP
jgi:cytochrome c oxidase assembly protein Cox11